MIENPKYIAQSLLNQWESMGDNKPSLDSFLRDAYQNLYVQLCRILRKEPVSFAKWLQRPIESV